MKICKNEKKIVLEAIHQGNIDAVSGSFNNLIDDIILCMKKQGVLSRLEQAWEDKRESNLSIPLSLLLTLCVAAKMKLKTSVSDIPFAITDAQILAKLGCNMIDLERGLDVQHYVSPSRNLSSSVRILDCTQLEVNLCNENYELAEVVKDQNGVYRGYKMGNLRGLTDDSGVLEEVVCGSIKTHDLTLCQPMLLTTPVLKPGDFLLNDRGFLDRAIMNTLKSKRGMDTFVPVKSNMDIYEMAVSTAIAANQWQPHPSKKQKLQNIALVRDVGEFWRSDDTEQDRKVPLNACVVRESRLAPNPLSKPTSCARKSKKIIGRSKVFGSLKTSKARNTISSCSISFWCYWVICSFKCSR